MTWLVKPDAYEVWRAMHRRCEDRTNKNYYGRGITVCRRWKAFGKFAWDMGPRPSRNHTLERKRNGEGYSPGNCKWATKGEQQRNTRANRILAFDRRRQCITDWAAELGIEPHVLFDRLRLGWSVRRALTTPVRQYLRK